MPFSDAPKQSTFGGVFSSLSRQRTRRRRLATTTGAGLVVIAGGMWLLLGTGPKPGDHAPMVICALDRTILRADIDADGQLDEIHDQDRDGTSSVVFQRDDQRTTVSVGDARGLWQKLRGVPQEDMETRGTFGDFDGDGYLDLALFYSQRNKGDASRENMVVHEVRYGPLARDLSSDRTGTIRMRKSTFVYGVRATDSDHDGRAELQVFQSSGDGTVSRYIGRQDGGGVSVSHERTDFYGVADWPDLKLGWLDFGACAGR
ncbi:hypothetical protein OHA27_03030 [Streptomyces sp. NBC_01619]|uniref:hypothetical protein n=1 Tax=Streptomyces sp. NBC_01619 TaxID=2975901 RepID=UPI00225BEA80|nr:hypothetical protein [Streptomyces sp. NBC_01619]MCX4509291.1 hypothetical protein [Streptomyces sp. NBC_01619]